MARVVKAGYEGVVGGGPAGGREGGHFVRCWVWGVGCGVEGEGFGRPWAVDGGDWRLDWMDAGRGSREGGLQ